ncbi:TetR/AcrR family transcriptional regulator [Mycobacterium sherrisii]|uniref:TetR family transcriptional regulator n=1 Tax=Mycobacterium sherrisii TaxID=243061 RepID=A0A1E3SWK3_9MYCO|nr:TetR family transcriptional regulator [Mycobacterium sherrisii]MCV7028966.1 TetR/AcrR family transcriptional regulator [Mycobacterium sherrisii]ODR06459.1 TetR family transcriptional regulator [Mycobacterium sherrisii]ORW82895.1 TetR family transcriptional regulator [Mycobacterium sherrisii]
MPSPGETVKRRGRRQGGPVSREAVLRAAKRQFARHGYDKTTLRVIADDARVDPSMILYLFGSKAGLFRESMTLVLPADLLTTELAARDDRLGYRVVRAYLGLWEEPETAASMASMVQSATSNPDANEAFRGFLHDYLLTAVSGALGGGDEARLRAMLAATNLVGTAMLRYIMRVPPLSSLRVDEVVALVGPAVHRFLTVPADELGLDGAG